MAHAPDPDPEPPDADAHPDLPDHALLSAMLEAPVRAWRDRAPVGKCVFAHPAHLHAELDTLLRSVRRAHAAVGHDLEGPWAGAHDRPELPEGPRRDRLYARWEAIVADRTAALLGPHRPTDVVRAEARWLLDRLDGVVDGWVYDCLREGIARLSAPTPGLIDAMGRREPDGLMLGVLAQSPYLAHEDALYLMNRWPNVLALGVFSDQIGRPDEHYGTLAAQLTATDWSGRRGELLLPLVVDRLQQNPSVPPELKLWVAAAMVDWMGLGPQEAEDFRRLVERRLEELRREGG